MRNETMKVLIVSDTHGHHKNLVQALEKIGPIDTLIHCGDVEGQEDYIEALAGCPTYIIAGNNDYFSPLEREMEFTLAGYRIFLTHGHTYGVSMGVENITDEGRGRNADIVMFGHTHRPCLVQHDDITVLNPGSISYPRQQERQPSFILMEIDRKGVVHYTRNVI